MSYMIPQKRYNETIKNLGIEQSFYKSIEISKNGKAKAVNKYDVTEEKAWHKSKFAHILHGLFLGAPQPVNLDKVRKIFITPDKVQVRLGLTDWRSFNVV